MSRESLTDANNVPRRLLDRADDAFARTADGRPEPCGSLIRVDELP